MAKLLSRRVEALFNEAAGLSGVELHAYLATACENNEERQQVLALIEQSDSAQEYFGSWASNAVARFIAEGATLSVGDSLGPYQITRRLGAGGMGEVYEAFDAR